MLENLFSIPMILIYALLFGVTMKLADLLNEHGLKWFKGSAILFGFLWGLFGSLMILGNPILAIFLVALVIHWTLRYRLDYFNHGLAASMMLITFFYIFPSSFNWEFFTITFLGFSIHGLINDAIDRGQFKGVTTKYFESNIHWIWIPLLLSLIDSKYWIVFFVSTIFIISYEFIKYFFKKKGYH